MAATSPDQSPSESQRLGLVDHVGVRGLEKSAMNIAYISGGPLTMKASHIQIVEMCRALTNLGHHVALYLGVSGSVTAHAPLVPEWLEVPFDVSPFYADGWGPRQSLQRIPQMLFRMLREQRRLVYVRERDLEVGLLAGLLG